MRIFGRLGLQVSHGQTSFSIGKGNFIISITCTLHCFPGHQHGQQVPDILANVPFCVDVGCCGRSACDGGCSDGSYIPSWLVNRLMLSHVIGGIVPTWLHVRRL
jgi:hypothetical protein